MNMLPSHHTGGPSGATALTLRTGRLHCGHRAPHCGGVVRGRSSRPAHPRIPFCEMKGLECLSLQSFLPSQISEIPRKRKAGLGLWNRPVGAGGSVGLGFSRVPRRQEHPISGKQAGQWPVLSAPAPCSDPSSSPDWKRRSPPRLSRRHRRRAHRLSRCCVLGTVSSA